MPPPISSELRSFLVERLPSMEQVDIVVLLRSDRERSWTAPEVAAAVRTPPESAAMRLFLLASSGLLAFEAAGVPRYRYVDSDAATVTRLHELDILYRDNRGAILALLGGRPSDPIKSFADAFKLR